MCVQNGQSVWARAVLPLRGYGLFFLTLKLKLVSSATAKQRCLPRLLVTIPVKIKMIDIYLFDKINKIMIKM